MAAVVGSVAENSLAVVGSAAVEVAAVVGSVAENLLAVVESAVVE